MKLGNKEGMGKEERVESPESELFLFCCCGFGGYVRQR